MPSDEKFGAFWEPVEKARIVFEKYDTRRDLLAVVFMRADGLLKSVVFEKVKDPGGDYHVGPNASRSPYLIARKMQKDICPVCLKTKHNQPAAGKAGITSRLAIEHHRPGLPEPGRCVNTGRTRV